MSKFKAFLRKALVVVAILVMAAAAFFLGRATVPAGSLAADYSDAASFLKTGSPTFCDMSERARMLACPAYRMYLQAPSGGAVIVYRCAHGGNEGFAEVIDLSDEERKKFLSDTGGLKVEKHCESNGSEVFRISSGGNAGVRLLDI